MPKAKKEVKQEVVKEVAKKNTSVLIGFQLFGALNETIDIVIGADHKCHTIAEIKKVMVEKDIKGKVYIMREEPIERIVKEVVTFA